MTWAHPRSRGENGFCAGLRLFDKGSSPLTRGKLKAPKGSTDNTGLIPAHAGKTPQGRICRDRKPAHPRSRGENSISGLIVDRATGSSPLTRGKQRLRYNEHEQRGLIPAHAGKTYEAHALAIQTGAHPRSRGENKLNATCAAFAKGSSPLTRGKPSDRREHSGDNGLIPAHAGKTSRSRRDGKSWRAHPRSRGENGTRSDLAYVTEGSSPLTRGKRGARDHRRGQAGLIPAHAGKTKPSAYQTARCTAHPRSRGENVFQVMRIWPRSGSSPLTRGKHKFKKTLEFAGGLIPAHAGKTSRLDAVLGPVEAHPRSRGENSR